MKKTKNKKKKSLKKKLKEQLTKENIRENTKKALISSKYIVCDNIIVFIYVFGAVINGMILRGFTIGNPFSIRPILADLVVSLLFASFYFFVKKKYRTFYLILISIISVLVCFANAIYYFYYSSFISITFFSFALANHDTGEANVVGNLLSPKFLILIWLPIAIYIASRKLKKKEEHIHLTKKITIHTIYAWLIVILVVFLATLKPVDYSRLYSQWNREYLVSRFGVYLYQINDIVKSIEPKMATLFGKDKAYKEINDFYDQKEKNDKS